jgi:hypothetical protein
MCKRGFQSSSRSRMEYDEIWGRSSVLVFPFRPLAPTSSILELDQHTVQNAPLQLPLLPRALSWNTTRSLASIWGSIRLLVLVRAPLCFGYSHLARVESRDFFQTLAYLEARAGNFSSSLPEDTASRSCSIRRISCLRLGLWPESGYPPIWRRNSQNRMSYNQIFKAALAPSSTKAKRQWLSD